MLRRALVPLTMLLVCGACGTKAELVGCESATQGDGATVRASIGRARGCAVGRDLSLPLELSPGEGLSVELAGQAMPVDDAGRVRVDLLEALLELPLERLETDLLGLPVDVVLDIPITIEVGDRRAEVNLHVRLASDEIPWSSLAERRWSPPSAGEATVVLQEGGGDPRVIGPASRLADATTIAISRTESRPTMRCGPYRRVDLTGAVPSGPSIPQELGISGSARVVVVVRPAQGRVASQTFEPACPEASYTMSSGRGSTAMSTTTTPIERVVAWVEQQ